MRNIFIAAGVLFVLIAPLAAKAAPLVAGACVTETVNDPVLGTVIRCIHPGSVKVQWNPHDYDYREYERNRQERQRRERNNEDRPHRDRGDGDTYRLPSPESMDCDYGGCRGTYRQRHPDSARP